MPGRDIPGSKGTSVSEENAEKRPRGTFQGSKILRGPRARGEASPGDFLRCKGNVENHPRRSGRTGKRWRTFQGPKGHGEVSWRDLPRRERHMEKHRRDTSRRDFPRSKGTRRSPCVPEASGGSWLRGCPGVATAPARSHPPEHRDDPGPAATAAHPPGGPCPRGLPQP